MFEHIVRRRLVDDELPPSCYARLLSDYFDCPKSLHFNLKTVESTLRYKRPFRSKMYQL